MLSNPTTRLQVLLQKFAAMAVATSVLAFVLWLSVVIGGAIIDMDLSLWRTAQVTLSGMLLGILFSALALMFWGSRGFLRTSPQSVTSPTYSMAVRRYEGWSLHMSWRG